MFTYSNWSVLTVNFLVVLYLALGSVALCSVLHLVGARWRYEIRQLASSLFALFPLAFVLLIVLLVGGEMTFPWLKTVGEHGHHHLPAWHNYTFLVAREVLGMLAVIAIYGVFIQRQAVSERSPCSLRHHGRVGFRNDADSSMAQCDFWLAGIRK
jgi:uncharacterized SAM-binding protein YcdF (DUF218 family)